MIHPYITACITFLLNIEYLVNSNATNSLQTSSNLLFPISVNSTKSSSGPAHKGCAERLGLWVLSPLTQTRMHTQNRPSLICGPRNLDSSLCRQCYLTGPCLYIHKETTHSSWRNELCIRHPGPELKEKKKRKTYFERLMQLERSHTRGLVVGKTLSSSAEQIPFLPLMLGTMSAVVWDALASVPGIFSIKHKSQAVLRWVGWMILR